MGEVLVIAIITGAFVAWVADLVRGTGLGLFGDMTMGATGAIGSASLFEVFGVHMASGAAGIALGAGLGAAAMLFVVRLFQPDDVRRAEHPAS